MTWLLWFVPLVVVLGFVGGMSFGIVGLAIGIVLAGAVTFGVSFL